ncbi:MAG: alpha/beta hydrolase [Deltaproteobacteria bacterium]|nr:MAG: alpha/beta hydrolase [Deltaproteobacteria bacterium]
MTLLRYPESDRLKALDARLHGHDEYLTDRNLTMIKKLLFTLIGCLVALVLVMVGTYYYFQFSLKELTPEERAKLPGEFVQLDDGVVSYYWKGTENRDIVVLVHGLSTPKFVWDGNVDALTAAGKRVLVYDHLGRGFSDRPDIVYDGELYIRELSNLLDALHVTQPVTLVGYSMGGGNVIGFAARYPERVKKLILIAPAGYVPSYEGLAALIFAPGLGEWLMTMVGKKEMLADILEAVEAGKARPDMVEKFEEQFQYRGYLDSILSTMRNYPMYDLSKEYEKVGRLGIPTFAIWGVDDQVVPFSTAENVKKAIPHIKVFPVDGAGHSVTYAESEKVNEILVGLMK